MHPLLIAPGSDAWSFVFYDAVRENNLKVMRMCIVNSNYIDFEYALPLCRSRRAIQICIAQGARNLHGIALWAVKRGRFDLLLEKGYAAYTIQECIDHAFRAKRIDILDWFARHYGVFLSRPMGRVK